MDNLLQLEKETATLKAITIIANFIDSKEEYNSGHSSRVAIYAEAIARRLGWGEAECTNIHYVALLHDIGKIGVPTHILNKKENLNGLELAQVQRHTVIGEEILKDIKTVDNVCLGALYHHENYDGSGYPHGIAGEDIPMIARVIAAADAYDAMSSDRNYRENFSDTQIREEFLSNAGKQFDPAIVEVVVRMIDDGELEELRMKFDNPTVEDIVSDSHVIFKKYMDFGTKGTNGDAETDYLTAIWNRRNGERHITDYLTQGDGALAIVDLDNFKMVNDTHGHLMGDHALKQVADVLKKNIKDNYVCRYGGDEFLLFLRGVTTIDEVEPIIQNMFEEFAEKCKDDEILSQTSLSVGIALSAQDGRDYKNLFRCADRALYYIKQNGKGGHSYHNSQEARNKRDTKIDLEQLVRVIRKKEQQQGAYRVEYQQFMQFQEFVEKFTKRNHQSVQLVLLTIDFDNSISMDFDERDMVMQELVVSVTSALRSVDICTRFSSAQLLVVLVDATEENVPLTVQRMLSRFFAVHRPMDIKISYDSADITTFE